MSDDVVVASTKPIHIELEPGEYYYCSCGRSASQPFCDGSHKGTGISPLPFTVERKQTLKLCQCKQTQEPPFCDGSHHDLSD